MLLGITREDQDVIQVDEGTMVDEVLEESLTSAWKTPGALMRPKDMTRYSKCPREVLKAVFHSSSFRILTR